MPTDESKDKFIETALKRFRADVENERAIRDEAKADLDFRAGEQWDPALKAMRTAEFRPALTFDKTHVYIQSVANEARQNKPQPKCNPIGGGATEDTAIVLNGILRHIQHRSHADVASDTALDYACGSSFGYMRAVTEYLPKSSDQEIRILPVLDPFTIYGILIPRCLGQEPKHMFVVETIDKEEYENLYGDPDEATDWESSDWKLAGDWLEGDRVRIAEYWWIDETRKKLRFIAGPNGDPLGIYTDEKGYSEDLQFICDDDGQPLERSEMVPTVKFCKMDGTRVLPGTETEWAGPDIPCEPVLGQQLIIDGTVHLFSLIRFIRDAQCLINVYKTTIAEKMALANRIPYIGYKGQFVDPKWEDCNTVNYPYLEVEPVMVDGKLAPIPQRQQLEEQITALSMAVAQEIDDLKSGMGIYDASLGAKSNETSGVAQARRQQQSSVTNFHFSDNLNRSDWDLCVKLLKVIPKIYDRPGRQVRIVGEDQQHSVVVVNAPYVDEKTGKTKHYALDVGDYDVVVTVGPSYQTAMMEGADTLQQFFTAAPQAVPLLGDLYVGSLPYTWAREGARRLKAAAPQQIVNDQDDQAQKIPPQVQQHLEQLGQQNQQMTAVIHQLQDEIDTKSVEMASRERIAAMQEETKRTIALATLDGQQGIALLQQEVQALNAKHDRMHEAMMQQADQQHQAGMQAGQQQHQADMQQGDQQNEADQQQADQAHQADMQGAQQGHESNQASQSQDAAAQQQAAAQQAAMKMAAMKPKPAAKKKPAK